MSKGATQVEKRHHLGLLLCLGLVLILMLLSLSIGAGVYGFKDVLGYWRGEQPWQSNEHLSMVIETLRLPRTLCALLVGASLAMAASLLQSATRNPLAEPGLLGVNAGAVLGLVIGLNYFSVESTSGYLIWAGLGALVSNLLVLMIGHAIAAAHPLKLILVGLALSSMFGGLANYILLSNQAVLDQFRFWNLGSLAASELKAIAWVAPFTLIATVLTFVLAKQLMLMQLGDVQAKALGIATQWVRIGVLCASTLFVAAAIAVAGPIGFVGFLAAYCARMVEPIALPIQIIYSAFFGIIFLTSADILARWLVQPFEMPNGVLLALIGAPVLIVVVQRGGFRSLLAVKA